MRRLSFLLVLAGALTPGGSRAQQAQEPRQPPSDEVPGEQPLTSPPAPGEAPPPAIAPAPTQEPVVTVPPSASSPLRAERVMLRSKRPRWLIGSWLLNVHLGAGIEMGHRSPAVDEVGRFECGPVSVTCHVASFGVGGQLLWRGLLGFGLALYGSEGAPLVPDGEKTHAGLADRVSVVPALAVRPLAWIGWNRGDEYLSRLAGGLAFEVGPSIEYFRTGSATVPGCDVPTATTRVGFHGLASLEVPLVGDARTGWVALRFALRVLAGADVGLAPKAGESGSPCVAQVVEPGRAEELLVGFSYSL